MTSIISAVGSQQGDSLSGLEFGESFQPTLLETEVRTTIATLERSIKRLSTLQSHDALCLLKNSISMPKLLYILRTSPCANNPLLQQFDVVLKNGLETILNVQLADT